MKSAGERTCHWPAWSSACRRSGAPESRQEAFGSPHRARQGLGAQRGYGLREGAERVSGGGDFWVLLGEEVVRWVRSAGSNSRRQLLKFRRSPTGLFTEVGSDIWVEREQLLDRIRSP